MTENEIAQRGRGVRASCSEDGDGPCEPIMNPWQIIGFKGTAEAAGYLTATQVQSMYRAASRSVHPDRNPDKEAHAQFMQLQGAKDFILDKLERDDMAGLLAAARSHLRPAAADPDPDTDTPGVCAMQRRFQALFYSEARVQ